MLTLIKNGQVIDPANQLNGPFDILINNRKIEAIELVCGINNLAIFN
jgi:dihydroorotase-like cyclic amidohydrolase